MRKLLFLLAIFLAAGCSVSAQVEAPKEAPPVEAPKETAPVDAPKTPEQPKAGDSEDPNRPRGVLHLSEVKDPPTVHAQQKCTNYSFVAALEGVLAYQKVELKQDMWADKYYGGSLCLDDMGKMDDIIRKTEGEYTLDDGRKVELKLQYFPGVPSNTSALLVPILTDEIQIVFIDGHADLLTGAMWDDWQSKRGERMVDLKELHLLDPMLETDKQRVVLDGSQGDFLKITGFMKVKATEVHVQYWPK
ncbi:hypothetical protein Acid345_4726 [Candidatus Koribacter versatilis Ellin345]|uniref:Lipoprotein n=1 Tax=Koribacter versatilis (strain Ellin345) TaxID=204669 RepID=Q1IHC5_KORVE|nr:hypothetical protein [Candidatus Koribacter versatilis]ABF43725.1 hypothetical protein Acid345_4726 [Candidatus Koribacter versatilis Ellin345]